MSKNAANKRRAKAKHRREFSPGYVVEDYLNNLIALIPPTDTPLLSRLRHG